MSETTNLNFKIRAKLKEHGVDASVLKFGEAMLKDGSAKVVWNGESLAQGVEVMIETPEGLLPAPDGVHELEDGTMIEVAGGVVSAVKTVEETETPDTPAAAPVAPVAEQSAPESSQVAKTVIESTVKETRFSKEDAEELFMAKSEKEQYDAKFNEQSATIEALTKQINELKLQLSAVVDLLDKKPADEPAAKPVNPLAFARQREADDMAKVHALIKLAHQKNN